MTFKKYDLVKQETITAQAQLADSFSVIKFKLGGKTKSILVMLSILCDVLDKIYIL